MAQDNIEQAVEWLKDADGILITAGAGMGIDSGLPDFRGPEGFWKAYPALRERNLSFHEMASPVTFREDPALAWGFYGHRLALYRDTVPHEGFQILRRWSEKMSRGSFVFTSNVDEQFQKAGFNQSRIMEVHGTIHSLQCSKPCRNVTFSSDHFKPQVDPKTCTLTNDVPICPHCGSIARPNILMFNDGEWVEKHTDIQQDRMSAWLKSVNKLVVVEIGAGKAIPTVRHFSECNGPRVIRINLREEVINPKYGVGLAGSALEVLTKLDQQLKRG